MIVDNEATQQAPEGWTIWRTNMHWQAMRDDSKAWGPMRRRREEALNDAKILHEEGKEENCETP